MRQARGRVSKHAMGQAGDVCTPACNEAGRGGGVYPSMQWGRQGVVPLHAMGQAEVCAS